MILACHRGCGGGAAKKMGETKASPWNGGSPSSSFCPLQEEFQILIAASVRSSCVGDLWDQYCLPATKGRQRHQGHTHTRRVFCQMMDVLQRFRLLARVEDTHDYVCMPKGWWWIQPTPVPTNNSVNKYKTVCLCPYKMLPNVKLVDCSSISKHLLIYSQSDKGEKYWIF